MVNFVNGKKHIHFIGIGGSGMYPLAQILYNKSFFLTGSDNNETETLKEVRKMGIKVSLGHAPENIDGADLIIYSAAIMADNPELAAAKERGIETRERAELLGLVTEWYPKAVCITGTHGKTTVSSMITHILLAGQKDISAVIGGKLKLLGGSSRLGKSDIMVCEACEFNDTFLKLSPNITIILNIDADHMDYFKNMDNLKASFSKFCGMTTDTLVINGDDLNTADAVRNSGFKGNTVTFGYSSNNNFYPANIKKISDFQTDFSLIRDNIELTRISIFVPGEHNVLNAVAACAASVMCGTCISSLSDGLKSFYGAGRRFERIYDKNGIVIVDDYAHHPAEIKVTLCAAKNMNFKRIWAIHQPFTFTRTETLLDDFADVLKLADKVTLTPIMGSREINRTGVTSEKLAEKIPGAEVKRTFEELADYVSSNVRQGDLLITMGCGDVYKAANLIAEKLSKE